MRDVGRLAVACLLASLAGCGWILDDEGFIQDRSDDYRAARRIAPPEVPGDLSATRIDSMMVVPEVPMAGYDPAAAYEAPRPATLYARKRERNVRIQRLGDARWIVAPAVPEKVWPRVKQFLADNGVGVAAERPGKGEILTRWLQVHDQSYPDIVRTVIANAMSSGQARAPYHRLRVRVEQAVRHGATEIHVAHRGAPEPRANADWSTSLETSQVADSVLTELANYLAADVGDTGVSYLAQTIAAEDKAEIIRIEDDQPALRLRLGFDRTWATVATALENASVEVREQQRDSGRFRIRFDPRQFEDEDSGFWSRLFGSNGKVRPLTLQVDEAGQGYNVLVYQDDGPPRPAEPETAEEVLSMIREFAS